MNKDWAQYAIGEIVTVIEGHDSGAVCIVEEIIRDPKRDPAWGGLYSLYGWEKPNPSHKDTSPAVASGKALGEHPSDWYYGDVVGSQLQTTGYIATAEEILDYGNKHNFQGGYWSDIEFMAANRGKTEKMTRKRGMFESQ